MQSATFMGAPTNSLQSTITYPVFNLGGAALAAAALAAVGISARAADVNFTAQVTRRLKLAAAIPAIWMVIQILPMPFWSHSIWVNTNEALNQQSWGHISVDPGKTFAALRLPASG